MSDRRIIDHLRQLARTQRAILLGAAVLVGALVTLPLTSSAAPGPYAGATLTCPATAAAGSTISISGSNFPATTTVFVVSDLISLPVVTTTTGSGTFTTTVDILSVATSGNHTLVAVALGPDGSIVTATCKIRIT